MKRLLMLAGAVACGFTAWATAPACNWFDANPSNLDGGKWSPAPCGTNTSETAYWEVDTDGVDDAAVFTAKSIEENGMVTRVSSTLSFTSFYPVNAMPAPLEDAQAGLVVGLDGEGNTNYYGLVAADGTASVDYAWVKLVGVTPQTDLGEDVTIKIFVNYGANPVTVAYMVDGTFLVDGNSSTNLVRRSSDKTQVSSVCYAGYSKIQNIAGDVDAAASIGETSYVTFAKAAAKNDGTIKLYKDTEYSFSADGTYTVDKNGKTFTPSYGATGFTKTTESGDTVTCILRTAQTFDGGAGSEANPYVISTALGFQEFSYWANNNANTADKFYKLGADFDLTQIEDIALPLFPEVANIAPFGGTFDGNNMKITYAIDAPSGNAAFFGYSTNAVFKNVQIEGTITVNDTEKNRNCAIFLANAYGTARFENITTDGSISGNMVKNAAGVCVYADNGPSVAFVACTNRANITTPYTKVGGIFGYTGKAGIALSFEDCYNNGTLTITGGDASAGCKIGGMCAGSWLADTFSFVNCANDGTLAGTQNICKNASNWSVDVGGVMGQCTAGSVVFTNCVNAANITAVSGAGENGTVTADAEIGGVGGILGRLGSISATFKDCSNSGTITSTVKENPTRCLTGQIAGYNAGQITLDGENVCAADVAPFGIDTNSKFVGMAVAYADDANRVWMNLADLVAVDGIASKSCATVDGQLFSGTVASSDGKLGAGTQFDATAEGYDQAKANAYVGSGLKVNDTGLVVVNVKTLTFTNATNVKAISVVQGTETNDVSMTDLTAYVKPNEAFAVIYTAEEGYLFEDGSDTKEVANAGVTEDTTIDVSEVAPTTAAKVKVGTESFKYYLTLQAAANAAQDGDTITVLDDVDTIKFTDTLMITNAVTLDLNDKTIEKVEGTGNWAIKFLKDLVIQNGTINAIKHGLSNDAEGQEAGLSLYSVNLTADGCAVQLSNQGYTSVDGPGALYIDDCTEIESTSSEYCGILCGNGDRDNARTVTINGYVETVCRALQLSGNNTAVIGEYATLLTTGDDDIAVYYGGTWYANGNGNPGTRPTLTHNGHITLNGSTEGTPALWTDPGDKIGVNLTMNYEYANISADGTGAAVELNVDGTITITDGEFSGSIVSTTVKNFITGGDFYYVQPTADVIANGYTTTLADPDLPMWRIIKQPSVAVIRQGGATTNYVDTIAEAIATEGAEQILLLKDFDISEPLAVNKSPLKFNLNGHTVNYTAETGWAFRFGDSAAVVSEIKNGTITSASCGVSVNQSRVFLTDVGVTATNRAAQVTGACMFIVDADSVLETTGNDPTLSVSSEGAATAPTVVINGTVKNTCAAMSDENYSFAICGNDEDTVGMNLTIADGATVTAPAWSPAIYFPCAGSLTINKATITGSEGVYVKAGTTTVVNGATINGIGEKGSYVANGNGTSTLGDAFVVDNMDYPAGTPTVTISGGTFNSTNGKSIGSYGTNPLTKFVSGGSFNTAIDDNVIADGYYLVAGSSGYAVQDATGLVAAVRKRGFVTLEAATVAAAGERDVTLLANAELATLANAAAIDMNGKNLSITGDTLNYDLTVRDRSGSNSHVSAEGTKYINADLDFSPLAKKQIVDLTCTFVIASGCTVLLGVDDSVKDLAKTGMFDGSAAGAMVVTEYGEATFDGVLWLAQGETAFEGAGTLENPYLIQYKDDLLNLAAYAKQTNYLDKCFKQMNDIALDETWTGIGAFNAKDNICWALTGTKAITTEAAIAKTNDYITGAFKGVYDGNDMKISGLILERGDYVGFFGSTYKATIKNLTISLGNETGFDGNTGDFGGAAIVGVSADTTIENCQTAVAGEYAGITASKGLAGIVGYANSGTVLKGCVNNLAITTANEKAGGIIACAQNGNPWMGQSGVVIDGCTNNGNVTCTTSGKVHTVGLVSYSDCAITFKGANVVTGTLTQNGGVGYSIASPNGVNGTVVLDEGASFTVPAAYKTVYDGKAVDGLFFATVAGDTATLVKNSAAVKDASLKVMATGATVSLATLNGSITLDETLASATVTTTAEGCEVTSSGEASAKVYTVTAKSHNITYVYTTNGVSVAAEELVGLVNDAQKTFKETEDVTIETNKISLTDFNLVSANPYNWEKGDYEADVEVTIAFELAAAPTPVPPLPEEPTAQDVTNNINQIEGMSEENKAKLNASVAGEPARYNAFSAWSAGYAGGQAAAVAKTYVVESFQLSPVVAASNYIFENAPVVNATAFTATSATSLSMTLELKDGDTTVNMTTVKENLASCIRKGTEPTAVDTTLTAAEITADPTSSEGKVTLTLAPEGFTTKGFIKFLAK